MVKYNNSVLFTIYFMDFHRRDNGICVIYSTWFRVYVLPRAFQDRVISNSDSEPTEF